MKIFDKFKTIFNFRTPFQLLVDNITFLKYNKAEKIISQIDKLTDVEINQCQMALQNLITWQKEDLLNNVLLNVIRPNIKPNTRNLDYDTLLSVNLKVLNQYYHEFSFDNDKIKFEDSSNRNNRIFKSLVKFIDNHQPVFDLNIIASLLTKMEDQIILADYLKFIVGNSNYNQDIEHKLINSNNTNIPNILNKIKLYNELENIIPEKNIKTKSNKL